MLVMGNASKKVKGIGFSPVERKQECNTFKRLYCLVTAEVTRDRFEEKCRRYLYGFEIP